MVEASHGELDLVVLFEYRILSSQVKTGVTCIGYT
jgi:hypothetical protein